MDIVQKQLEHIEQLMQNILESPSSQGAVAGSASARDVSNGIDLTSSPLLNESSPDSLRNMADGTADPVAGDKLSVCFALCIEVRDHPISRAGRSEVAKLMPRFRGPYKIATNLTPVTARLVDPTSGRFVTRSHVSFLKAGDNSNGNSD
jgi:hypothetical protein